MIKLSMITVMVRSKLYQKFLLCLNRSLEHMPPDPPQITDTYLNEHVTRTPSDGPLCSVLPAV